MVSVLIVDDHVLIRQAIRGMVEKEPDLRVVAEAGDGQEAALLAAETQPDVVLMDLTMPVCGGFEATERVLACSPHSRVVVLSASDEERDVLQALQRGAIGYVTKDIGTASLLTAIRRAAQGELYVPPSLAERLLVLLRTFTLDLPHLPQGNPAPRARRSTMPDRSAMPGKKKKSKLNLPLTEREKEILNLIRQGQRNREIARTLRIAEPTVHKHIQNIFEKLDARNRAEALFLAKG
jgi:two-component system nitrate/nitrite response regulator NarL